MQQFRPFPIFVNNASPELEKTRQRLKGEFAQKRDAKMFSWLDSTLPLINEVQVDRHPTFAMKNYEDAVMAQLSLVYSNPIGKLVIEQLDLTGQELWIVPFEMGKSADCMCSAFTFPGDQKAGGGLRIYYDPSWYSDDQKTWIGSDDILLHELVHAYRIGFLGYFGQKESRLNYFPNGEEFIATEFQNVYLGFRGSSFYYQWYQPIKKGVMTEVYDYFTSNEDALAALKYFLSHERIARIVSRWLAPKFNPFRDFASLEHHYLEYMQAHGFDAHYPPY